jgi:acyl phosphate:glycerol-3-phosphate acyltransferase
MPLTLIVALSYLLGSIPFGYLLVRGLRGKDVRQTGSGNIGATNVSRTSPTLGFVTLLLDGLKGAGAVLLAAHLFPGNTKLEAIAALFAILGHVFPWWLKFRGGKGVATGTGAFLVLVPKAALVAMAVFAAIFLLFRYVSLASMAMFVALPLAAWFFGLVPSVLIIVVVASALVVAKHHENIQRLLNGCESRWGSR